MMARPRHQPSKAELLARMPRAFRPKLSRAQIRDLAMAHLVNLDAIATGQADAGILWQMVGGVLTWSFVSTRLQIGEEEMKQQLELALSMLDRFKRTGRVLFTGPEYQLAKVGVDVMDQLAELVDQHTACEAADESERLIGEMVGEAVVPTTEDATP